MRVKPPWATARGWPSIQPAVEAYGTVDETNATVGLARLHATDEMAAALARISNDLFDLGADLAPPTATDADVALYPLRMIAARSTGWSARSTR
jgi:cob(I)alamin adenosyltransferase